MLVVDICENSVLLSQKKHEEDTDFTSLSLLREPLQAMSQALFCLCLALVFYERSVWPVQDFRASSNHLIAQITSGPQTCSSLSLKQDTGNDMSAPCAPGSHFYVHSTLWTYTFDLCILYNNSAFIFNLTAVIFFLLKKSLRQPQGF